MSYTPVVPIGGYAGWRFLQRTETTQKAAFVSSAALQRDEAYFRERIGSVGSAEELVADRRLLKVALGAFGLGDDLANRFFIRKVLEEGTTDRNALANRLSNKAYAELSQTFGFDRIPLGTASDGFADSILAAYETRSFEAAVGEVNDDMRLAMNAERELTALAERDSSDNTLWYSILASKPLRTVFEQAFGLPSSFGALDIDVQLRTMKSKARAVLGDDSIRQFAQEGRSDALIRRFLLMSDVQAGTSSSAPGAGALTLLRGGAGAESILSLLIR